MDGFCAEEKLSLGERCQPTDQCKDQNAYCTTEVRTNAARCQCRPEYYNRSQRCG